MLVCGDSVGLSFSTESVKTHRPLSNCFMKAEWPISNSSFEIHLSFNSFSMKIQWSACLLVHGDPHDPSLIRQDVSMHVLKYQRIFADNLKGLGNSINKLRGQWAAETT